MRRAATAEVGFDELIAKANRQPAGVYRGFAFQIHFMTPPPEEHADRFVQFVPIIYMYHLLARPAQAPSQRSADVNKFWLPLLNSIRDISFRFSQLIQIDNPTRDLSELIVRPRVYNRWGQQVSDEEGIAELLYYEKWLRYIHHLTQWNFQLITYTTHPGAPNLQPSELFTSKALKFNVKTGRSAGEIAPNSDADRAIREELNPYDNASGYTTHKSSKIKLFDTILQTALISTPFYGAMSMTDFFRASGLADYHDDDSTRQNSSGSGTELAFQLNTTEGTNMFCIMQGSLYYQRAMIRERDEQIFRDTRLYTKVVDDHLRMFINEMTGRMKIEVADNPNHPLHKYYLPQGKTNMLRWAEERLGGNNYIVPQTLLPPPPPPPPRRRNNRNLPNLGNVDDLRWFIQTNPSQ